MADEPFDPDAVADPAPFVPLATEWVPTDSLVAHPRNARQGDIGAIAESIKAHGIYKPLVVQRSTRHVLAGNHTLKAARAVGIVDVPVQWLDVDDDQAMRILLVDNRTTDVAAYDDQALAELLAELATGSDRMLAGTGFSGDDLDDLIRDLDVQANVTLGDDATVAPPLASPPSGAFTVHLSPAQFEEATRLFAELVAEQGTPADALCWLLRMWDSERANRD